MDIQEYELKVGVFADERMNIKDLLQYLESEMNEFLINEVKKISAGTKSNQRFTSTFERIPKSEIEQQEYVGFLFIYNNSEFESLEYIKRILSELGIKGTDETFLIIVEMEGREKINLAYQQGKLISEKYQGDFVKLSFENSHDLIVNIRKYINTMIQNYYFPTEVIDEEVDEHSEQNTPQKEYQLNYIRKPVVEQENEDSQYYSPMKDFQLDENFLEKASRIRQEKMKSISEQEKQIDQNITNLQKVLENMDVHIKSKVETDWYGTLKNSIYSKVEKESDSYSKIKLTQHFLKEETNQNNTKIIKVPVETVLLKRRKNPILKLQLVYSKHNIVVEVFEDSTYNELSKIALRKMGLKTSEKNIQTMESKIKNNIVNFVEELTRSIKLIQREKLAKRKFLK